MGRAWAAVPLFDPAGYIFGCWSHRLGLHVVTFLFFSTEHRRVSPHMADAQPCAPITDLRSRFCVALP